jgi:hypothetical protein
MANSTRKCRQRGEYHPAESGVENANQLALRQTKGRRGVANKDGA